jgi:6-phosphogluconolactonase (cycloisomerase 2 family)
LFVIGTATAQSNGSGTITGFKINHNTGQLTQVNGLPVASGGANPSRAVLISNSRFLYVLNRGTTASGSANCTTTDPCINSNITQFAVGGNGILTAEQTFYTQGVNPFRLVADTGGNYLYVLDHDAPDSAAYTGSTPTVANPNSCMDVLATASCGDITVFSVNSTTGRLSLVTNAQATANLNNPLVQLTYFPVPPNPVDFTFAGSYVITLNALPSITPAQSYPYNGGTTTFPYQYSSASGQLSLSQNTSQQFAYFNQGTAIVFSGAAVYLLDNEPPVAPNSTGATSQILPFTVGTGGSLNAMTGGPVADDPTQTNPIYIMTESKGKWVYVANFGSNVTGQPAAESGTAGYVIDPTTKQLSFIAGEPWGTGSGPMCLVEDPSNQYIYTANFNDSTVTGRVLDQNAGVLNNLRVANSYSLTGQPTWCLISGRTD